MAIILASKFLHQRRTSLRIERKLGSEFYFFLTQPKTLSVYIGDTSYTQVSTGHGFLIAKINYKMDLNDVSRNICFHNLLSLYKPLYSLYEPGQSFTQSKMVLRRRENIVYVHILFFFPGTLLESS